MNVARPTILSLFSGVGGLDLGIQLAVPGARVLGYVERDAYAATVLLARMEDSSLEEAPVFIGDICNLRGSQLPPVGSIDIICGGFPCQDISVAGKGAGIGGKRSGLWSEIVRLADEIRPRYLFLENVSAITSRGLDVVLADLAEGGFDAEWLCLRASDVGAPHWRERWFCLAYQRGYRWQQGTEDAQRRKSVASRDGEGVADALGGELRNEPGRSGGPRGSSEAEPRDDVPGIFPPGPNDHRGWGRRLHRCEWLAPAVEPGVRLVADGQSLVVDLCRADQLRCSGNGVVALCAAVAFVELMRRAGVGGMSDERVCLLEVRE